MVIREANFHSASSAIDELLWFGWVMCADNFLLSTNGQFSSVIVGSCTRPLLGLSNLVAHAIQSPRPSLSVRQGPYLKVV